MNKITYSRTTNLGDFNSERVEYTIEYEELGLDGQTPDDVFDEAKRKVLEWAEAPESKSTVTKGNGKPAVSVQGDGNPWCDEHDRDFFKTKNMRSYAHPLESGGWHNMDSS